MVKSFFSSPFLKYAKKVKHVAEISKNKEQNVTRISKEEKQLRKILVLIDEILEQVEKEPNNPKPRKKLHNSKFTLNRVKRLLNA